MGVTVAFHVGGKLVHGEGKLLYEGGEIVLVSNIDEDTVNSFDLYVALRRESNYPGSCRLYFDKHAGNEVHAFALIHDDASIRYLAAAYDGKEIYDVYVEHDVPSPIVVDKFMQEFEKNQGVEDVNDKEEELRDILAGQTENKGSTMSKDTPKSIITESEEISDDDEDDMFEIGSWVSTEDIEEMEEVRQKIKEAKMNLQKGIPVTYLEIEEHHYVKDNDGNEMAEGSGFGTDEIGSYEDTDSNDEIADHGVRKKSRLPAHNANTNTPYFELGMTFDTITNVREAVKKHSIKDNKDVRMKKNDSVRVRAHCKWPVMPRKRR